MYTSWALPWELLCMLVDLWVCPSLAACTALSGWFFFLSLCQSSPHPPSPVLLHNPHSLPFSLLWPFLWLIVRFIQALKIRENWGALFPSLKSLGRMALWVKVLDSLGIFWLVSRSAEEVFRWGGGGGGGGGGGIKKWEAKQWTVIQENTTFILFETVVSKLGMSCNSKLILENGLQVLEFWSKCSMYPVYLFSSNTPSSPVPNPIPFLLALFQLFIALSPFSIH